MSPLLSPLIPGRGDSNRVRPNETGVFIPAENRADIETILARVTSELDNSSERVANTGR